MAILGKGLRVILATPLLLFNFSAYVVLLSLAGWSLNEMLDMKLDGANAATQYLIIFSLLAGVVGVASVILGFFSLTKTSQTDAASSAMGLLAWVLSLLALGLSSKQIHIGKVHNKRLKALEAFAIIVAGTQLLYLLLDHVFLIFQSTESTTAPASTQPETKQPLTSETV